MTPRDGPEVWHALLGPLPAGVLPERKPVAPPELAGTPEAAPVAGWENLMLHLSAGGAGLRVVQAVVDESGRPISGSDHVLFRSEPAGGESLKGPAQIRQESIGGRFETDGSFRGTCWLVTGREPVDDEQPRWEMTSREPSADEVAALRTLLKTLLDRDAGREGR